MHLVMHCNFSSHLLCLKAIEKIEKAAAVMHQFQKPQNHVSVCFMELSLLLRFFASAGKQVSLFYVSSYLVHFKTINTLRSLMRVQAADF